MVKEKRTDGELVQIVRAAQKRLEIPGGMRDLLVKIEWMVSPVYIFGKKYFPMDTDTEFDGLVQPYIYPVIYSKVLYEFTREKIRNKLLRNTGETRALRDLMFRDNWQLCFIQQGTHAHEFIDIQIYYKLFNNKKQRGVYSIEASRESLSAWHNRNYAYGHTMQDKHGIDVYDINLPNYSQYLKKS